MAADSERGRELSRLRTRVLLLALAAVGCGMLYWLRAARPAGRATGADALAVQRLVKSFAPPARVWRAVVVHHSATASGNARIFHRYHRDERGWTDGLGYHFVIGNGTDSGDGQIEGGVRWRRQLPGAHCGDTRYNNAGVGVCLVGDFEEGAGPTPAQLASLVSLIARLRREFHIPLSAVLPHRRVPGASTKCPGRHFPMAALIARLRETERPPADR